MSDVEFKNEESESAPVAEKVSEVFADVPAIRPNRLPVVRQLTIVAGLLLGVFSLGAAPYIFDRLDANREGQSANTVVPNVDTEERSDVDPFSQISIAGQSAIVVDVKENRVLYKKSPDLEWPLASITKLMTALVAREVVDEGLVIPMTTEALSQSGDSGLKAGERFSYRTLSDLLLLTSSNDGAYALAAAAGATLDASAPASAFVKAMNVRAKELGLESTYFRNPTGLDISESEAGAYGTAKDVSTLMEYILKNHPDILEETTRQSSVVYNESGVRHDAENTNRIVEVIPAVIASKTGYTTLSGGNLVVAFDAGVDRPVIVVVLGSTHQGRFADVLRLTEAARSQLSKEE